MPLILKNQAETPCNNWSV